MEDLWEFNQERLVRAIYDSELPVISGVGHEIDVTLCDLAADRRALTPSEAAELISPNVQNLAERLQNAKSRLDFAVESQMDQREMALNHLAQNPVFRFPTRMIDALAQGLDVTEERLNDRVKNRLEMLETQMGTQAARLEALSPLNVLSRGYTVTQDATSGKVLRSVNDVQPGQKLKTRFPDGECVSRAEN